MTSLRFARYFGDDRGTAAIEFAIVGPIFMGCMVGIVYMGLMLFSYESLQYAVEQSARCWALNISGSCTSSSTAQTYAANVYYGPSASQSFTATSTTCGYQVTGTATMKINWILGKATVPMTATACFP